MSRQRVICRGRVQGVGFRAFVRREARTLGLTGWVRNEPGGSVHLEAQGAEQQLAELRDRLLSRSPGRIDDLETSELPTVSGEAAFVISR